MLGPFDALIGTWATEATHPLVDQVVGAASRSSGWRAAASSFSAPATFDQRFAATLGPDAFQGQWQVAESSGAWREDLMMTYRRCD